MRSKVIVGVSAIGGVGIFAAEDIARSETVLRFRGRRMTGQEVLRAKGDREGEVLQIGPDLYIDPVEPGRSTNHSCEPNAGIAGLTRLVALRPIRKGAEITFDYSTTIGDLDGWEMDCACGARTCRKRVRAYSTLPAALRRHYADLGVVQKFLLDQRRRGRAAGPSRPRRGRRAAARRGAF